MEPLSKILINAESKDEGDNIFNGLSIGGQIEMPIEDSPWGKYFEMFRDKLGIKWWLTLIQNKRMRTLLRFS